FRYTIAGRTRDAGLGTYPTVTLIAAREQAEKCRRLVAAGADPIKTRHEERQRVRVEAAKGITLQLCAQSLTSSLAPSWKNAKANIMWQRVVNPYAKPLAPLPVRAIDTALVMQVLEPIWAEKAATASQVRTVIEAVLNWAKARGYRSGENPA